MARIHDEIIIEQGHSLPSLGTLLGTRASAEVFESVHATGHSSFFGGEFDNMRQEFFNRYVRPMDQIGFDISRTVNALMNPDKIRILDTLEEFQNIPPSMEMAICLFEPVRKLALEGRVEFFGYDPTHLPEDVYGRMIDNFTCEDVLAASNDYGYYDVSATMYSDDPDLTDDEQYAIQKTREFILNAILKDTDRDPTAISLPRG